VGASESPVRSRFVPIGTRARTNDQGVSTPPVIVPLACSRSQGRGSSGLPTPEGSSPLGAASVREAPSSASAFLVQRGSWCGGSWFVEEPASPPAFDTPHNVRSRALCSTEPCVRPASVNPILGHRVPVDHIERKLHHLFGRAVRRGFHFENLRAGLVSQCQHGSIFH
jgi:hypothetical protein